MKCIFYLSRCTVLHCVVHSFFFFLKGILTTITGFVIVCLDYKIPKLAAKYILIEKPFVKEDVYTSEHRKSFATLPQLKVCTPSSSLLSKSSFILKDNLKKKIKLQFEF